jgi:glyoxylase-like metal-dependent hydrolase (beta-lactamase superfamily II)
VAELIAGFDVGEARVTMVSDGVSMAPRGPSWFTGIDPAEWMPVVGVDSPEALFPVNFGAFLIQHRGTTTLVDSGFGELAANNADMDGGGGMLERLASIGVEPADVDRIIQTHLHADHCGWLVRSTKDPEPVFPRAEVVIHADEVAYWRSDAAEDNLAPAYTRARLDAVAEAGLLVEIDGSENADECIEIVPTPGHTPGHVSVIVRSGGETAFLLGDVAHHCVHFEKHSWLQNYDVDPPTSIATRGRMAAMAVEEDALVTAPHLPALTLVRLERADVEPSSSDSGYRYSPV